VPESVGPLIVGSGIAGLYVALRSAERGLRPTIITKSRLDESNTRYAQGGIAAAIGADDSVALHLKDTVRAGDGLVDLPAARALTREAPARIADLVRYGVPFDTVEGQIALGREGAHSRARILHAGGDATGLRIEETLRQQVIDAGIPARERRVLRALRRDGREGVVATLATPEGRSPEEVRGRTIVLATGGAGSLYRESSNPSIATGEGVAIAFRAGAVVSDMEFIQFHPTTFYRPGAPRFLITEALRGEGARVVDEAGRRFLPRYHAQAELAPRDIVSRAIRTELVRTGAKCVYLDATRLPADRLYARFPTICRFLREYGIDPARDPIPVTPAAHYMIGGVTTDLDGRTSLPGLLACGEVAATGVHGANRLASNSLLEGLVFGERVVRQLVRPASGSPPRARHDAPLGVVRGEGIGVDQRITDRVRDLLWEQVGIVRTGSELTEALSTLDRMALRAEPADPAGIPGPTANHVLLARLIARSALRRKESRGAHFRTDHPAHVARWRLHLSMHAGHRR
jgi:L-aspartate oxidase